MNESERARFLDLPLLAIVSTIRRNGSPHAVPVWYRFDGERVLVWSGAGRGWVKQLRRDPRVAVAIAEDRPPYRAVLLSGEASYHEAEPWIDEEIRRITGRYIAPDEVEPYIAGYAGLAGMVVISPHRTQSWGRGY